MDASSSELNTQSYILKLVQELPCYLQTTLQKEMRKMERDEHRLPTLEDLVYHVKKNFCNEREETKKLGLQGKTL